MVNRARTVSAPCGGLDGLPRRRAIDPPRIARSVEATGIVAASKDEEGCLAQLASAVSPVACTAARADAFATWTWRLRLHARPPSARRWVISASPIWSAEEILRSLDKLHLDVLKL